MGFVDKGLGYGLLRTYGFWYCHVSTFSHFNKFDLIDNFLSFNVHQKKLLDKVCIVYECAQEI
jgi:hypothetical protein